MINSRLNPNLYLFVFVIFAQKHISQFKVCPVLPTVIINLFLCIIYLFFALIIPPTPPPQAGLTVRAVQKYLLGTDMSLFTTEHLDGGAPTQPYPSNSPVGGTTETTETYQSPPFTENNAAPTYQVPIY